jgi:hypothetical protein
VAPDTRGTPVGCPIPIPTLVQPQPQPQVYLIRARAYSFTRSSLQVKHNWAGAKPWRQAVRYLYYSQLGLVELRPPSNSAKATAGERQPLGEKPLRLVVGAEGPPGSMCWPLLRQQAAILANWQLPRASKAPGVRPKLRPSKGVPRAPKLDMLSAERLPLSAGGLGACWKGGGATDAPENDLGLFLPRL